MATSGILLRLWRALNGWVFNLMTSIASKSLKLKYCGKGLGATGVGCLGGHLGPESQAIIIVRQAARLCPAILAHCQLPRALRSALRIIPGGMCTFGLLCICNCTDVSVLLANFL